MKTLKEICTDHFDHKKYPQFDKKATALKNKHYKEFLNSAKNYSDYWELLVDIGFEDPERDLQMLVNRMEKGKQIINGSITAGGCRHLQLGETFDGGHRKPPMVQDGGYNFEHSLMNVVDRANKKPNTWNWLFPEKEYEQTTSNIDKWILSGKGYLIIREDAGKSIVAATSYYPSMPIKRCTETGLVIDDLAKYKKITSGILKGRKVIHQVRANDLLTALDKFDREIG